MALELKAIQVKEWKERFVVPSENFLPESFGQLLEKQRVILLIGQSGIGKTSYFRFLTACYAAKIKNELQPKGDGVIFITTSDTGLSCHLK